MIQFKSFGITDIGRVRERNEDHILLGNELSNSGTVIGGASQNCLAIVADGIGGAPGGKEASFTTLSTFRKTIEEASQHPVQLETLRLAMESSNSAVYQTGQTQPELHGLGSTLAGCYLSSTQGEEKCIIFHAGDSRIYRYRSGFLKCLTRDHTVGEYWLAKGEIPWEEIQTSPYRFQLAQYIGKVKCDYSLEMGPILEVGDLIIACTDGLHDMLNQDVMESIIQTHLPDLELTANKLVEKVYQQGAKDNISMILISVQASTETPREQ